MVVHAPGAWFDETLDSLARQDYPNLNTFFLLTASPQRTGHGELTDAEIAEHITAVLPNAFVEQLGANPGFSAAANAGARLRRGRQRVLLHLPRRRRARPRTRSA